MTKILIAGMGNVLRRDDGFGVEVAKRLAGHNGLPDNVKVIEVGIGGIHLVQELLAGYDFLMIVDAVERGSAPGTVHILEAEVPDLANWTDNERQDFLADMHYTTPAKALILAKALGVLPAKVLLVGCQPADAQSLGVGLNEVAEQAVPVAIREIEKILQEEGTVKRSKHH